MRSGLLVAVLAALLVSCGSGEGGGDVRKRHHDTAMDNYKDARGHIDNRRPGLARESYQRAYDSLREALRAEGTPPRPVLLNLLANISVELGRHDPTYFGKAVHYAEAASAAEPNWLLPPINLAHALGGLGYLERAAEFLELVLQSLPEDEVRETTITAVIEYHVLAGWRQVSLDSPGAPGRARAAFNRAWEWRHSADTNPKTYQALSKLGEGYDAATAIAAKNRDPVAMAKAHAHYGFPAAAEQVLKAARHELGRSPDLDWVEVRYVEEVRGTPESLAAAESHYHSMLTRGEFLVQALAGWGRVLHATGRGEEALPRLLQYAEPSVELRRVVIDILLSRLENLPEGRVEEAGETWAQVEEFFQGGLVDWRRAELLLRCCDIANQRKEEERLEQWIRQLTSRFPRDLRVLLFELRLREMRGLPIEPEGR